jgi:hypothetical protein
LRSRGGRLPFHVVAASSMARVRWGQGQLVAWWGRERDRGASRSL